LAGSGGRFGTLFLCADLPVCRPKSLHQANHRLFGFSRRALGLDRGSASGVVAIAGGLSILLGYRAKLGAWLIVLFLIPVTLMLHKFWTVQDPMMAQIQMILFMKNVSMLGGALLISQFGAGPFSLDARRSR
jgi:uncharacterized membrane protein YphA (DoxX/SURF4 family)